MNMKMPARSVVAIASGKGGVGKSTIALNVATVLAQQGVRVGLLDCDVYGPDIAVMTGLTRHVPVKQWTLARQGGVKATPIKPVNRFGVELVSIGLLFGETQSLSWPAELIRVLLTQLVWSSEWPELDYLIIDMPPGTADVTQAVFELLPRAKAVVVVTPQEVAHLDARKLVTLLKAYGIEIIGGIDNMSTFQCPSCANKTEIFPSVQTARSIWSTGVERLGTIPLDPMPDHTDTTIPVVLSRPESAYTQALQDVVKEIRLRAEGF